MPIDIPQPVVLEPQHKERLTKAGLSDQVVKARRYETATSKARLASLGFSRSQCNAPSLVIPIYDAMGTQAGIQIRPDNPRFDKRGKPVKYDSPPNSRPVIDISPAGKEMVYDPRRPLIITEGAIKADAAVSQGIACVSVPGVWAYRLDDPFWARVPLIERQVFIAFDSDQGTNPNVQRAAVRLHGDLQRRGAKPTVLCLPEGKNRAKQGLDDYLAAGFTAEDLLALPILDLAAVTKAEQDESAGCYCTTPNGLVREVDKDDEVFTIPLCNFNAWITADVEFDNGYDTRHEFEIKVELNGEISFINVPAEEFERMNWIVTKLGPKAIVHAGFVTRDHARAAIQSVSCDIAHRKVYEHIGWAKIGEQWVFLHAGGIIGTDSLAPLRLQGSLPGDGNSLHAEKLGMPGPIGPIPNERNSQDAVAVHVPPVLRNYRLPVPPDADELKQAVSDTLDILEMVAPPRLYLPLLAATFRIAIDSVDFSIHLVGRTNLGKTELLALFTQFFGADLHARNLPGSWNSTSNHLLAIAALAKNVIFPIDDFVPTGSQSDIDRANRDAAQVFRAQGNHAGRGRCGRDGTPKEGHAPHTLPISTGEDLPEGVSLNSRLFSLEVKEGDILSNAKYGVLSLAQRYAREGRFAKVMAAFLNWIAPRYEEERATLRAQKEEFREAFRKPGRFARAVDIAADLLAGFDQFLDFCKDQAGLSEERFDRLWSEMHDALNLILDEQQKVAEEADPVSQFMSLVATALTTGLAHLKGRGDPMPAENQVLWGWKEHQREVQGEDKDGKTYTTLKTYYASQGIQIGWVGFDQVFLDPDATLAVVQKLAKDSNLRPLALTKRKLGKALHAKGLLLQTSKDHYTDKLYLNGVQKRVLHFHASKVIEYWTDDRPDSTSLDSLLEE